MTKQNQVILYMIKGLLSELSPEDQARVEDYRDRIRTMIQDGGDLARLAVGLVGAELADES